MKEQALINGGYIIKKEMSPGIGCPLLDRGADQDTDENQSDQELFHGKLLSGIKKALPRKGRARGVWEQTW